MLLAELIGKVAAWQDKLQYIAYRDKFHAAGS